MLAQFMGHLSNFVPYQVDRVGQLWASFQSMCKHLSDGFVSGPPGLVRDGFSSYKFRSDFFETDGNSVSFAEYKVSSPTCLRCCNFKKKVVFVNCLNFLFYASLRFAS